MLRSRRPGEAAEAIQAEAGGTWPQGQSAGQPVGVSRSMRAWPECCDLSRADLVRTRDRGRCGRNRRISYHRRKAGAAVDAGRLLPEYGHVRAPEKQWSVTSG